MRRPSHQTAPASPQCNTSHIHTHPTTNTNKQVDQWLDTSSQLVSGLGFETLCGRLNDYLSLRTFFVGFTATAADFAIWGQLHGEWWLSAGEVEVGE